MPARKPSPQISGSKAKDCRGRRFCLRQFHACLCLLRSSLDNKPLNGSLPACAQVHDDLLRLSMSSAIMHLSRIFFFDEMGGADLCSALRNPHHHLTAA